METAWLIETVDMPHLYWMGSKYSGRFKGIDAWTTDSTRAIRFSRELDAKMCITMQEMERGKFQAMEHSWG